jgi:pimeloyl-ACP methyl ester carboxylesterase
MDTVRSADGTVIAFDRHLPEGESAATVILIGGAFSYRAFPKMVGIATELARRGFTAINYDRRGRGDSGDTPGVYDVQGELDDLAALVAAAGGRISLFGWSSGAVLALLAAASGQIDGIERVVAYDAPFVVDHERHVPPAGLGEQLRGLVAADRRSEAVRFYLTKAMGIPGAFVTLMRVLPFWATLKATASSTPHDWAVMEPYMRGEPLDRADWAGVDVPTLVISGGKSEPLIRTAARAAAEVLPGGRHVEVPKLGHNPDVTLLVSAVAGFLGSRSAVTPRGA